MIAPAHPLLHRLMGTETEYALRFRPAAGSHRPGNEQLFEAIREGVSELVHTRKGLGLADAVRRRVFTENGGSLYYESVPGAYESGLVEAGTPECRGATQLLLYQRAQDRLLFEASRLATETLRKRGFNGDLGLLKNCRDVLGNVYGAQESYSSQLASNRLAQVGWWITLIVAIPLAMLAGLFHWLVLLVLLALLLPICMIAIGDALWSVLSGNPVDDLPDRYQRLFDALGRAEAVLAMTVLAVPTLSTSIGIYLFGWRRERRAMTAFLASRMVVTGAGTLIDGQFHLSEKAAAIQRTLRWSVAPSDRGLYETGHLIKPLHGLAWLDVRAVSRLFDPTQRLQVGMSDSNLCQEAEWLKMGTTALVLDLAEAGLLDDAPVLYDPIAAAHAFSAPPTLGARADLVRGTFTKNTATALELQRFYYQRAAAVLAAPGPVSLEARRVVELWGEVLERLDRYADSPRELVGRLDWVTKRHLIDNAVAEGLDADTCKKIDLRYHELGTGYHATLDAAGLCTRLVDDDAVADAMARPPAGTPAQLRGEMVRSLSEQQIDASVSWHEIQIPGKIIPLTRRSTRKEGPSER